MRAARIVGHTGGLRVMDDAMKLLAVVEAGKMVLHDCHNGGASFASEASPGMRWICIPASSNSLPITCRHGAVRLTF
jgi:hypothetical protein